MSNATMAKELTRDVLITQSPEEIMLLENYNPRAEAFGSTGKGPQGFGGEAAMLLLMPLVYKFFEKFIERMATRASDGTWGAITEWFYGKAPLANDSMRATIKKEIAAAGVPERQQDGVTDAILLTLQNKRNVLAAQQG